MSGIDAMNFAELDTERKKRTGFPEVVFCQGKKDDFLKDIFAKLYAANGEVLGTRATAEQFVYQFGCTLKRNQFHRIAKY